jgi:hypothetical protein
MNNLELFDAFSGEELHYTYPHGDEVYIVDVVYQTSDYSGEIEISNESNSFEFFEIDNIPNNISPPVKPVVKKLEGSDDQISAHHILSSNRIVASRDRT